MQPPYEHPLDVAIGSDFFDTALEVVKPSLCYVEFLGTIQSAHRARLRDQKKA